MKYLLRIITFPFILSIILISYNFHALKHSIKFIINGGEWITYDSEDKITIKDIYMKLKDKNENSTRNS
jgi:hypothetical protein